MSFVQSLHARRSFGRIRIKIGMMLGREQTISRSDLSKSATPIESERGIVIRQHSWNRHDSCRADERAINQVIQPLL